MDTKTMETVSPVLAAVLNDMARRLDAMPVTDAHGCVDPIRLQMLHDRFEAAVPERSVAIHEDQGVLF
jgi:hypothetical protein